MSKHLNTLWYHQQKKHSKQSTPPHQISSENQGYSLELDDWQEEANTENIHVLWIAWIVKFEYICKILTLGFVVVKGPNLLSKESAITTAWTTSPFWMSAFFWGAILRNVFFLLVLLLNWNISSERFSEFFQNLGNVFVYKNCFAKNGQQKCRAPHWHIVFIW